MNYTYMIECKDKTIYTGWTNNISKRLVDHNSGKGAKYTKGRAPVTLVYLEAFETKQEAMKREYYIKQLTKNEKLDLIRHSSHEHIHKYKMADTSSQNE